LAEAVGYHIEPIHPHLELTKCERARGKELLAGADLALQPGARHDYKRLTMETLTMLVTEFQSTGFRPVLVGGKEEAEYAERLLAFTPGIMSLVGKCTLRETMGVLAEARVSVGADTGVMHLAAAVGSPTVTVFEPSQPSKRWGHLYAPHQVVEAPDSGIADVAPESITKAVQAAVDNSVGVAHHEAP
jgi:heptosyltransferase-3